MQSKNENFYLFNEIFSNVEPLSCKIKEILTANKYFAHKITIADKHSVYEIVCNFSHKKNRMRSLFIIIHENLILRGLI